jgi:hypothetical protein
MLEKTIEAYLVKRVRAIKGIALKFTSPSLNGVPDRIVFLPNGRIHFVELKRPGGIRSKNQIYTHALFESLGQCVYLIDSKVGIDCVMKEWGF